MLFLSIPQGVPGRKALVAGQAQGQRLEAGLDVEMA